ncbi:asparaginase [Cellulomonas cellasea]|uniref:asparaginase n=1 Tax=Cellulomonas cellasea TaxID=43670 RepID=UPI0025A435CA|nr:asparaginase [Cellulomonas cellasea]MDM8086236.1 asparaginase [Cellulomonas cellasea]
MPAALLAQVVRGDLVESEHVGSLVVLGPDGAARLTVGDPDQPIYGRSSLKPLQAVAMLRNGLDLHGAHLALAAASHNGEPAHVAGVREILAGAGLDESALQNTPTLPLDAAAALEWQRSGRGPESVAQNCSGKHAAMLATCVAAGWDTASYLDPQHPLQQAVRQTLAELTGEPASHPTVDGCGAPLFATTLRGLARAFAVIARAPHAAPGSAEARVAQAMSAHPWHVAGTGRDATEVMLAVPGLIAKDGAEGVYAAALPDGGALAFKVADGSARPRPVILREALRVAGADQAPGADVGALDRAGRVDVLGHGRPVGAVIAAFGATAGAAADDTGRA